jgi:hypothetical protein
MLNPGNKPLRPPLQSAPEPSGFGNAVSGGAGAAIEPEPTGSRRPADSQRPKPATAANVHDYARRKRPAKQAPPAKPTSEALAAAKEKALRIGQREFREEFGESLTRDEWIQVVRAFGSAIVPKRKAGRPRKAQVTAALADWKAGMRGVDLYRKHIPGWQSHNRYRRMAEQKSLLDAIRSRRRREHARSALRHDPTAGVVSAAKTGGGR